MADDGSFNDAARAAIYQAGDHRCIGCGRPDLTCQHRQGRGMGGTSEVSIGHPANGVPLCGSGTTGCHGWTERHPRLAELLGWRLMRGTAAIGAPYWDRVWGWRCWVEVEDCPVVAYVDGSDLDRPLERQEAVAAFRAARPEQPVLAKPHR